MLPCPKCDHDNELGRIFCHQCGTKLDLSQIKAPGQGGKAFRRQSGIGSAFHWLLRLVIIAALIGGVYLMLQVPSMPRIEHGSADLKAFDQRLAALRTGISQQLPVAVNLTEPQIAAHLEELVAQTPGAEGVRVEPRQLQIRLDAGVVTANVIGRIRAGKIEKDLYVSLTGVPTVSGGRFELQPVAAAIGKLPIHPLILRHTGLVQGYFKQIYGELDEVQLLDQLTTITVSQGVASLAYRPGTASR